MLGSMKKKPIGQMKNKPIGQMKKAPKRKKQMLANMRSKPDLEVSYFFYCMLKNVFL